MHLKIKRICAALLCLVMLIGFMPIHAQAALADGSDYITQQLYLGSDLMLHLRGSVDYLFAENAVATVTCGDQVDTYRVEDLTVDENGQAELVFELAAAQMTEDITLRIKVGGVVIIEETYSIRNYIQTLLNGNYSAETEALCLELLNYGAWAQRYFDYREGSLADAGYTIAPANPIPEEYPGVSIAGNVSGIHFYGTSLRFLSQTAMRFYFAADDGIDGYTFTVNGEAYTPEEKDGLYFIEIANIGPRDMSTEKTVTVTDGTSTQTVQYAPVNYFIRSYHSTDDATTKGLMAAAYSYFMMAKDYTEETDTPPADTEPEVILPPDPANLLLGFDSYENITGARILTGNYLGRMQINTDPAYITQGKGSLLIQPQGDYSEPGKFPYLKLDFLNSTCATDHFSAFKNISFDVFNPQSEELHIRVGLVIGEDESSYLTTIKQVLTVAPNGWTTCAYDLSYMAGYDFYDLSNVRYMSFEFIEHKESKNDTVNTLYIDSLRGVAYGSGEGPATPQTDYSAGITFEAPGQEYLFTGQGIQGRDAEVERVAYGTSGAVAAPTGGGSYGLKLSHTSNYWPTFRLHFGQTLPAGTELSFMAYSKIYGTSLHNQAVFEYSSGGDATDEFACGQWTQLYMTLPESGEYVDLFFNIDRAVITSEDAAAEVYIDNIKLASFEPVGDIVAGYGFEERGNAERFTGTGNSTNDASIKRLSYTQLGLSAPVDGGTYALVLTHSSSQTPYFRINFGKTLPAGTTISFNAYAKRNSGYLIPEKHVIQFADGTTATSSFKSKTWSDLTLTLPADGAYIDLIWSFKASYGTAVCELYIDNIKATLPAGSETPTDPPETGSDSIFITGVDFETAGNEALFTGTGATQDATIERVSYGTMGVSAPANGGSYALKLSHQSHCWPSFRVNFGSTLKAGTTITFDFYGNYDYVAAAGVNKYMKLEIAADSKGYATSADPNQVVWTLVGTWKTGMSITLTADTDHVDFFYNVADGGHGNVPSWILLDNFKAVAP
ncbi:MAG: hypothetical protein J6C41_00010 [Oscillospiraceae bacterium]|nr:hypothetical protein [Oscillospiraceae bacterium]